MNKPVLVLQAPVFTRSGYGDHSRDLLRSLYELDRFDIKIAPTRWGTTPQNQIDVSTEFGQRVLSSVVTSLPQKPDVFIQVSVANEFTPMGHYNIGITAGVESTIVPKEFVDGGNKMDLIIVPSQFTKEVMQKTVYQEKRKGSDQVVAEHRITVPIEVLHEGVSDVFFKPKKETEDILKDVETDWNFLIVGHWLKGDLGHDRKDIGMTLKTINTVFGSMPKNRGERPGVIMKVSTAGFSVLDRERIRERIESVLSNAGERIIPVYLLHGDLTEEEMTGLYHHPKVKAMVSFTKGEGYGRPLAEFGVTGKPIIVSKWSGQTDFLPEANTVFLDGQLVNIHESAADKFLMKEAQWFSVNYSSAANKLLNVYTNYDKHLAASRGLATHIKSKFSMPEMTRKFGKILDNYVTIQPKMVPLNLPTLQKL